MNIFRKFNIDNRQVFSITCDNGANIVKMVHILNDIDKEDDVCELDNSDSDESYFGEIDCGSRGNNLCLKNCLFYCAQASCSIWNFSVF